MRDIKFRAWFKKEGEKIQSLEHHGNNPAHQFRWIEEGQPIILEQFTGLHDKNGKEIYEGDRIRVDGMTYVVEFKEGSFIYGDTCYPASLWRVVENCEIIGNIHQNPELLEELV